VTLWPYKFFCTLQ